MIFILNKFSKEAFGLATAVKEFSAVVPEARLMARTVDQSLLKNSKLQVVDLSSVLFSKGLGRSKVWHVDDLFAPYCFAAAAFGLISNKRVIICPHGMLDEWAISSGRTKAKKTVLKALNFLAGFGDLRIHALNISEAYEAKKLLANSREISIVPNGVPSDIVTQASRLPPRRNEGGPIVIGCMSRISPKKNQIAVVDLAIEIQNENPELFKKIIFKIDGKVEDREYADKVQNEIKKHNLSDKITFGGAVEFEDRAKYLLGYDVFFFPSKSEGMPYVVLEAMALGVIPLVSSASSCGFVQEFGGKVYSSLREAREFIPETKEQLLHSKIDAEAVLKKYNKDKLTAFLKSNLENDLCLD